MTSAYIKRLLFLCIFATFLSFSAKSFALPQEISNYVVSNYLAAKYQTIPITKSANIKIFTTGDNSQVTLIGDTKSFQQAAAIVSIAQSTPAIKFVDASELTVNHKSKGLDDLYITAKIYGLLAKEDYPGQPIMADRNARFQTVDGIVTITGDVPNKKYLSHLETVIHNVPGVRGINDRKLTVVNA